MLISPGIAAKNPRISRLIRTHETALKNGLKIGKRRERRELGENGENSERTERTQERTQVPVLLPFPAPQKTFGENYASSII